MRHHPKQSRGLQRVEHILDCAEVLFARYGYEHTTTNAIAAAAEVPIGSLYQYFEDKSEIFEAITERYLGEMREVLRGAFVYAQSSDLRGAMRRMIEHLVAVSERQVLFVECLGLARAGSRESSVACRLHLSLLSEVQELLGRATMERNREVLALRARVCVGIVRALVPVIVESSPAGRPVALDEATDVLAGYVESQVSKRMYHS